MGGGCNDAQAGKAPLSAAEVGGSFVLQYYRTLTTDKENLHKYYKDESICSRGFEGATPDQKTQYGVAEIREEIRASRILGASRAEISLIQSQESKQGGILVMVVGYFVYSDSPQKVHFTQVFFLDKQSDPYPGYFVQNDILKYDTVGAETTQAQPQTELPPPLLPPPQPPMLSSTPAATVVDSAVKEADVSESKEVVAEDEEQGVDAAEEDAGAQAVEEEEEDEEAFVDDAAVDDAAAAEAVAAAAEAAEAEEKPSPPSWASMASKLKEGGGGLANSKVQGFALPAPAKAKASTSLPSVPKASTMPVLPPASAAMKAKAAAKSQEAAAPKAEEAGEVRLWVSRLPMDPAVENQELLDAFNKLIADAGSEGSITIDLRRDMSKDWVYVTVSKQDVADTLVQHSKDRKISVKGRILKAELERKVTSTRREKGSGKGGGQAAEDSGEAKAADGGGRGSRRGKGGKGGSEAGGKGGKGGADAGGRRGGEKGGGGNWRNQTS